MAYACAPVCEQQLKHSPLDRGRSLARKTFSTYPLVHLARLQADVAGSSGAHLRASYLTAACLAGSTLGWVSVSLVCRLGPHWRATRLSGIGSLEVSLLVLLMPALANDTRAQVKSAARDCN